MAIERIVIGNLKRAQAFDKNLRTAAQTDREFEKRALAIILSIEELKRRELIGELSDAIISNFKLVILPQAERIGTANALDIARKIGRPIAPITAAESARAIVSGRLRASDRLEIITQVVRASGETLNAELSRFWLEPAEGTRADKLKRLENLHKQLEDKRKTFETDLAKYHDGETKIRPTEPKLELASKMALDVKKNIRVQARRAGTDAELAMFTARGHGRFVWIAPNGPSACPDCLLRQAVVLSLSEWERLGRPGSGLTICGVHCFCMLLPEETALQAPALLKDFTATIKPVLTTPEQLAIFNANRLKNLEN